jgi:hypothetical protein
MTVYVYAIAHSPAVPGGCTGLRDSAVSPVGEDGLFAAVSRHEDLRLEATEADLWAHERVVEQLMERTAVLPMRFGSTLADEAELAATLRERRGEWESALARVRGAVELAVRATIAEDEGASDAPEASEGGPGTSYMRARLGQTRRRAEVSARIHEPLAEIARESAVRRAAAAPRAASRPLLAAAYLVDTDRIASFRGRVAALDDEVAEATVACTGPWPPYSFTSEARS